MKEWSHSRNSDDAKRDAWRPYADFCKVKSFDPMTDGARGAYAKQLGTKQLGENMRAARLRLIDLIRERERVTR